jgi:hypothetical protein
MPATTEWAVVVVVGHLGHDPEGCSEEAFYIAERQGPATGYRGPSFDVGVDG